jgi:hypothetical protein
VEEVRLLAGLGALLLLAGLPASSNFQLNSYGFGGGGTANSSSSNSRVNGLTGEVSGSGSSANYKVGAGENFVKQANVPTATLVNGARWYNKLLLTIGPAGNPSDANFTVGSSLTFSDYLTYSAWGSGSGIFVRGLTPGTVYTVKVKAYRGNFTESGYGPTATAATLEPQMTFDIDVAPTDVSTSPPYQVDFGSLLPGSVVDAPDKVWVSFDTNAENGGVVYASGLNAGLLSTSAAHTIASLNADLSLQPEGFGVQGFSVAQTSGGPLTLDPPYDGTGQNVGATDATLRELFFAVTPLVDGRGSVVLKAKSQAGTPSATDYTELLTLVAAGRY